MVVVLGLLSGCAISDQGVFPRPVWNFPGTDHWREHHGQNAPLPETEDGVNNIRNWPYDVSGRPIPSLSGPDAPKSRQCAAPARILQGDGPDLAGKGGVA